MLMGRGWKLSVQETIVVKTMDGKTYYVYNDADGTEHYLYDNEEDDVDDIIDEDGLGLILTISGTTYTIKDKQDNQKIFANGVLTEILDANGNSIQMVYSGTAGSSGSTLTKITRKNKGASATETLATFSYSSSRLSQTTDKYGRNTTFTYDANGYLTGVSFADNQTVTYTYSSGKLYSAMDNESKYKIVYSAITSSSDGTKTRSIIEYANGKRGNSLITVNDSGKKATYTAQTWNGSSTVNEIVSTTYCFDNEGRTVTAYSHDANGKIYGASTTGYVSSDNPKQNNRVSNSSIIGVVPQNLLANGGLEDYYINEWHFSSSNVQLSTSGAVNAHTGNYAIDFRGFSTTSPEIYAYQSVTLKQGVEYTASAYVDASGLTFGTGGVYLKIVNSSGSVVATGTKFNANMTASLTDKWQRISVDFTPTSNGTYKVYICMNGASGAAYVDDILVEEGEAPSSYNLVDGVEKWGTGFSGSSISSSGNPVGQPAIKIEKGENSFNSNGLIFSGALKTVPIHKSSDTTFLLSAWAYLDTTPDDSDRMLSIKATVVYSQGSDAPVEFEFNIDVQKERQFIQGVIVPEIANAYIDYILLEVNYKNHIGTAYIYDVALIEHNVRTYTYDENGNPETSTQMGTTPVSTEYNSNNNIVNQTQGEESFDYKYENTANSHLATSVEQAGIKMEFTYNTAGALTGNRITSVNGNAFLESDTLYTSDKNYATGIEDVNGVYTYYHYSNGLLNYVRNEKDVQTNYTYYAGNDRQKSAYISDLVEVNYKYAKGMLSQIIRDAGENSTESIGYAITASPTAQGSAIIETSFIAAVRTFRIFSWFSDDTASDMIGTMEYAIGYISIGGRLNIGTTRVV
jgi:YD repeat-containing protein